MKQLRKIYDRAFKEKAIQLSYERTNISELARELGVTAPQLYKWIKEYEEFGQVSSLGNGNVKQHQNRNELPSLKEDSKMRK